MFCLLRNAQMTLHGIATHDAQRVEFVFPAQAIWAADIWGPGDKRSYPARSQFLHRTSRTHIARFCVRRHDGDAV
jgi:hypothetical protein